MILSKGNLTIENLLFNNKKNLIPLKEGGDGVFKSGRNGVKRIFTTKDRKVDYICFEKEKIIAFVKSQMGYPAMYPLLPVKIDSPIKAVLMDLDGTSVKSEEFWIWIIEQTISRLMRNPKFKLEEVDLPFVSGHSVSEHMNYCIKKYCPEKTIEEARKCYFEITDYEMKAILEGRGRIDAFKPTDGLKDFLLALKSKKIKIGLVTSGLYEKAWPEIYAAFKQLKMGNPRYFYDAIITAGYAIRKGIVGTLGELEPKPHPWLYAETARIGLGIDFKYRHHVIGIEDSGAGIVSIRLAGFTAIGMAGGNIIESGTLPFCSSYYEKLSQVLEI